ncbi:MAG: hypothetical protein WC264_03685 [Candidatus Paceibacterota bacterium]|jgi:hypothetical protein
MKDIFKKRKALMFSVLILVVFFMSTTSLVYGAGLSWFGGNIKSVIPCTCSGGSKVTIMGLPTFFSGSYLYMPGETQVRGKGNVVSGRQILGLYSFGGTCKVVVGEACINLRISKGTMTMIGTN